jgi:hypothetical protein
MTLLKDAGVPTPKFGVAATAAEARTIAEELGGSDLVIKAQVSINLNRHIFSSAVFNSKQQSLLFECAS